MRGRWRHLVVGVVYLAAAMGGLRAPRADSATAQRYPCEDCGCGCGSASECWTHCCCHTLIERLVWALENGVSPPRHVEISPVAWEAAAALVNARQAPGRAMASGVRGCHGVSCIPEAAAPTDRANDSPSGPRRAVSRLACKGLSAALFDSLVALLVTTSALLSARSPCDWLVSRDVAAPASAVLDALDPPPRDHF